jgi:hypothetical protein
MIRGNNAAAEDVCISKVGHEDGVTKKAVLHHRWKRHRCWYHVFKEVFSTEVCTTCKKVIWITGAANRNHDGTCRALQLSRHAFIATKKTFFVQIFGKKKLKWWAEHTVHWCSMQCDDALFPWPSEEISCISYRLLWPSTEGSSTCTSTPKSTWIDAEYIYAYRK